MSGADRAESALRFIARHVVEIVPAAPFNFDATLHKPDHFPSVDNSWEQRIYSRLFFDREPEDPAPVPTLLDYFNAHFAPYQMLAVHYFWEDLFWRRKTQPVPWLEKLIRL